MKLANKEQAHQTDNSLIGGVFGLGEIQDGKGSSPFLVSGDELFLVNARSCIHLLVNELKPNKIWLPSFLCDVVFQSLGNYPFAFYAVDSHLQIPTGWIGNVEKGDIVVFIDYFGFPFNPALAKHVKENGGWILEDASQALLTPRVGENSDFVVYSPRKFLGVPDGGILRNNTNLDFFDVKLNVPPQEWWLKAFSATMLRWEFDRHGGERNWFHLFQEADRNGPVGLFSISDMSKALLEYGFDYELVAQKRIANYKTLQAYLGKIAVFPELLDGVVPLGFPVRIKNRDSLRQKLFEHNIYPPIHWLIKNSVPDDFQESHRLSDTILTLVCDQRYNVQDMERTAKIVLEEAKH
jgi:hypothetical protein